MSSSDYGKDFSTDEAASTWRQLIANDWDLLEKEFASLRKFDPHRVQIAADPANKPKNRFGLVFPYDENFCRVSLTKDSHGQDSNYINASYIRNNLPNESVNSSSRTFYAAQAPSENTLDDFLRMIYEHEIDVIVMLSGTHDPITGTYAQEHKQYFGMKANEIIETDSFRVRTIHVIPNYRYTGRRLKIRSKITKVARVCEHYHYADFIDKGIPSDCHSLTGLVLRLLDSSNNHRRILVHCNAGVGRTGVFIALYYLMETHAQSHMLNVKRVVDTIRFYRPHLVQTVEQYEYIYRCLAEFLTHPCDGRPLKSFIEHTENWITTITSRGNEIAQNFQNRNERIESVDSIKTIAAEQNSESNRNQQFVPYDYNRVYLHPPSESLYINASHVMNIIRFNGTILTQEPMKTTLQPFFSMILQEHKTFIVAVEQMEPDNYTQPEFNISKDIVVQNVTLKAVRNLSGDYYRSHRLNVSRPKLRESDVFVFEYTGPWKNDQSNLPVNNEHFVRFVDRAILHQKIRDPKRLGLIVHDRMGGTKAAFYCIVQNIFDRLLIDGKVAMENFASIICQQRMNALLSLEQYIALHQMVIIWSNLKNRGALECSMQPQSQHT